MHRPSPAVHRTWRLIAAVGVLTGIVFVAAACVGEAGRGRAPRPAGVATTKTPSPQVSVSLPTTPVPPRTEDPGDGVIASPPSASPAATAQQVAQNFTLAWARPHLDAKTWWSGIAKFCESRLAAGFRHTDPANVPARQVLGVPVPLRSTTSTATFAVPTDAGALEVTTGIVGGRWLVTGVDLRPA